jgi:alkanesulfonate monooxygenase
VAGEDQTVNPDRAGDNLAASSAKGLPPEQLGRQRPPLRFHWSMSSVGERWRGAKSRVAQSGIPNLEAHVEFCRRAEACGIDSVLTAFGFHRADPMVLASALGMLTTSVKFMIAVRSGVFSPTVFVQQVNTLSALTSGRVCINVVGGHSPDEQKGYGDFLCHDDRYARTDEFLTVCRAFWEGSGPVNFKGTYYHIENGKLNIPFVSGDRASPEIFVGGSSPLAFELAVRHARCLWTLPRRPEELAASLRTVFDSGTEVGILVSMIARSTRGEAVSAARAMLDEIGDGARKTHREFARTSDSVAFTSTLALAEESSSDWLTPWLWTGAVPYLGAPAIALLGSYDDVAEGILEFTKVGITQFLFLGWPDVLEMTRFGKEVRPRVLTRYCAGQGFCQGGSSDERANLNRT